MRDLLLIAILVPCALKALYQPVFGLLLFTCLGFLNPHSMTWGIGRTFPFSQLAGITTIVGYLFWSEPKRFPRQQELMLLLALWGMFGISTLFAIYPDKALTPFIRLSKILLMVFLSLSLINTDQRLHLLLRVIAFSLGFYGFKAGIFVILNGGNYLVWGPEDSFLYANNSIGLALAMNIPLLWYLLRIETRRWLRWVIWAMLLLSYPATIFTYSRGAWIGLAMATALLILRSRYKFLIVTAAGVATLTILPALAQLLPERLVQRYDTLEHYEEDGSAQSRFWNWEFCRRVGFAHPLTGGGFDYYSIENYAIYFPEFLERWPGKLWSCHSTWYTIFGEHGFPGFILWVTLLGSCFLSLRRIRLYGNASVEMSWVTSCADALQASLVAFMVVGTFLDAAYFDMFYYLIGVIIILKERIRQTTSAIPSPRVIPASKSPVLTPRRALVG
jgi:probable O-glycosylation ligase (exosortase A-associated)